MINGIPNTKHPHYLRWNSMKMRCQNPNNKRYKYYGGRGISVCAEWLEFKNFAAWCDRTYEAGKTIDRKNNNGNYSPDNCRWATPSEQQQNSRQTPARIAQVKRLNSLTQSRCGIARSRTRKTCYVCKTEKPLEYFYLVASRPDGHDNRCKKCQLRMARDRWRVSTQRTHYVKYWNQDSPCGIKQRFKQLGTEELEPALTMEKNRVTCKRCVRYLKN